ncbi:mitochondrial cytochrome b-c1 complex subunit Rieske [Drechslerella stenobrocha 248]|uniref:Cytochrome b-c1 complex subunit Rieske, mitochondrial n=1 Tax=Drechslerella stenobrocha 248 TaxID=1043628 RepID=W7IFK6_9PEZI|nr:mitochondrial cytochrome b-c1 complex subunit Rieske [Drechslerella stenobrocha 248]
MAALRSLSSLPATASRSLLRTPSSTAPLLRAATAACTQIDQRRYDSAPAYGKPTTVIPDWGYYKSKKSESSNKVFGYVMVGSMGALSAAAGKATIQDFLVNMSASADVLAMAKVEVALNSIPEGKNVVIKWRGKPIFIRHRTADEIEEANNVNVASLRDPETDEARTKKPEWLVMVGVCTHLGCVPIGEAGEYGGWFCPCHGSHYDISGRIRKGPAPLNLEIPAYDFPTDETMVIG